MVRSRAHRGYAVLASGHLTDTEAYDQDRQQSRREWYLPTGRLELSLFRLVPQTADSRRRVSRSPGVGLSSAEEGCQSGNYANLGRASVAAVSAGLGLASAGTSGEAMVDDCRNGSVDQRRSLMK